MIWSWDVNEDTCAICNISITDSCPRVSTLQHIIVRHRLGFSFFESVCKIYWGTLKFWIFYRNISSVWIAKHVHMQQVNVVILFIFVVSNDGITRSRLVLFVQTNGFIFRLELENVIAIVNNRILRDFAPLQPSGY